MRLVAGVLAVMLLAPAARAEEPQGTEPAEPAAPVRPAAEGKPRKVSLRVVRMLPETHQVLLFDRARATHVLAEIGGEVDGYTVEDIGEDEVTLTRDGTTVVLPAPAAPAPAPAAPVAATDAGRPRERARSAVEAPTTAAARDGEPEAGPAPVDPYEPPAPRVVRAPSSSAAAIVPGEGGVRVARAPSTEAPPAGELPPASTTSELSSVSPSRAPAPAATSTPAPAATSTPAPAATSAPAPAATSAPTPAATSTPPLEAAPPPAGKPGKQARSAADARALADILTSSEPSPRAAAPEPGAPVILSRREVDGALADFARLAASVRGSFSPAGLVLERVGEGTLFQRAGLRSGDVITAIDGARLRTIDDAADLYARAATAKAFTVQLVRAGQPVTLRVAIQ